MCVKMRKDRLESKLNRTTLPDNPTSEANETPLEDLMNSDLKHYEEASLAIHHWSSGIPVAIRHYYIERPKMERQIKELKFYLEKAGIILEELKK